MQFNSGDSESHALRGAIDVAKLDAFRDAFTAMEPMASGEIDDRLNPRELRLTIPYGVGASAETVFTIRWTTVNDYNIHYSDTSEHDLRWDLHPHDFSAPPDDRHFHPPPDASSADDHVEASCLGEPSVDLVARAVHLLWRQGLDEGSMANINAGKNPP
ncbi:hypothetical protein [Halanaeroarchaeum sulfurireducens]|uniref:Uncharacterized protein n=1 Tax=Halanaeroarchaeum sulfurireducens TaxID=1604004 RepID=A0A0F7PF59_9EURY|nr:hypothetical protein [Halanaeroarchaeum sulfurireducens]AKH98154.1 hypothetical protein HLASF_1678 [Halanaeroarchaeum sulfurireducens]ALG82548.1 hypothetical protein HLASA_1665 [Halanaeroarchaeum sulfurireducens]